MELATASVQREDHITQELYNECTSSMEHRFNMDFPNLQSNLRHQYLLRLLTPDTYHRLVTKVVAGVDWVLNEVNSIAQQQQVRSSVIHRNRGDTFVLVNPKVLHVPTNCTELHRTYSLTPMLQLTLLWENDLGHTATVALTLSPASLGGLRLTLVRGTIKELIDIDFPFRKALLMGFGQSGRMVYNQYGYKEGRKSIEAMAAWFAGSTKSYE